HPREALLTEQRVVLDVDLRVERDDLPVAGDDQRVDRDEARVAAGEELHELPQDLLERLLLARAEPETEAAAPRQILLQPGRRMDVHREVLLRRLRRDLLAIPAARRRRHDRAAPDRAVDEQAQVELARDIRARFDIDAIDRQAFGTALMRDEPRAEHRL